MTPVTGPFVLEPTVGMKYKRSQRRSHKQQVAKYAKEEEKKHKMLLTFASI